MAIDQDRTVWFPKDSVLAVVLTLPLWGIGGLGWGLAMAWWMGGSLIGWLLQTKALIMIIFVNVLLDKQMITPETFTALLLMAVASTMLTVPMAAPKLARLQAIPQIQDHLLLAGSGCAGQMLQMIFDHLVQGWCIGMRRRREQQ